MTVEIESALYSHTHKATTQGTIKQWSPWTGGLLTQVDLSN